MKRQTLKLAIAVSLGITAGAAMAADLQDRAREMFSAIPQYPPVIDGNELTEAKLELGKMLFFEPRLSASHLISCNTCHNVGMGGHDYLLATVGRRGHETRLQCSTLFLMPPSSGMAGRRTLRSRRKGQFRRA